MPGSASDVEPHVREHGILQDPTAIAVHEPKVVLREGVALRPDDAGQNCNTTKPSAFNTFQSLPGLVGFEEMW